MPPRLYELLWRIIGGRPWTYIFRDWVKAHPKATRLIVAGSIIGFVSWMAFILHIFELW